jgi:hypothetical protein
MADARTTYGTGMTNAQIYEVKGWSSSGRHPGIGAEQLPGMADPGAGATPDRYEDWAPERRQAREAAIKQRTGADLDSMERSFGAQMDQAFVRADRAGQDPFSQHFYSGEPRDVIAASAKELGVPYGIHAAANAITSPQMKFRRDPKTGPRAGQTTYPNNELAVKAVEAAQRGDDPATATKTGEGLESNYRRAVRGVRQHLEEGRPVSEWTGDKGGPVLGPKTAAYHNSWLPDTPDFFTADVHSGGGGMVPHLSPDKPFRKDAEGRTVLTPSGKPSSEKAERERAIELTGFHTLADKAARRAMTKRGFGSVREGQAAQWGEEQIRRGYENAETHYGPNPEQSPPLHPQLFS